MQTTAVYSYVRILSEAVASLPLHVYRYNDDGGKEKAIDHPLYFLLHDEPNPEMTSFVFRETLMTHNQYVQPNDILICARNGSKTLVGKCALIGDMEEPASFGAFMAVYRTDYYKYVLKTI